MLACSMAACVANTELNMCRSVYKIMCRSVVAKQRSAILEQCKYANYIIAPCSRRVVIYSLWISVIDVLI